MPLQPGSIIDGKYQVLRGIGEGGMGAVYLGENTRIKRRVAIKVLHASVAENAEVVQRFEREAQAAGCIGNDHILEVLDIGALPNGERFIVMEFLDGEPMSRRIAQLNQMTPAQVAPLVAQLLDGLGAAHAAGITHRDLKPDNIFILKQKAGQRDFVKIIDFGISKFAQAEGAVKMTRAGAMMGTPLYMSPEQARGSAQADARSDIYAVGVIMYEATSGRPPFTAESFNELLFQIVLGEITPLNVAAPTVDPGFSAIVMKAMARDPQDRYQSTADFRSAIEGWAALAGVSLRLSAAPGLFAQTPIPGQVQPGRETPAYASGGTPYPGAAPGPGTPYPAGQQPGPGTPYPAGQQPGPGTPYPAAGQQPGPGTPYPAGQQPGAAIPYAAGEPAAAGRPLPGGRPLNPGPLGTQGSQHGWGAAVSAAPGPVPPKASSWKAALIGAIASLVAVVVIAAALVPGWVAGRRSPGQPEKSVAAPIPPPRPFDQTMEPVVLSKIATPDSSGAAQAPPAKVAASTASALTLSATPSATLEASPPPPQAAIAAPSRPVQSARTLAPSALATPVKAPSKVETSTKPVAKAPADFGY
jgi:serine/threonine-protein kinase